MELDIKRLEALRKAYGENVRDFAKRINISHAAYYYFLQKKRTPTLETIGKLAKALGLDSKDLIK